MSKDVFEEFSNETPLQRKQRLMEKYGEKLGITPSQTQSATQNASPKKEEHSHPANKNARVEKAYVESTAQNESAGEGCDDHYDERFIQNGDSYQGSADRFDYSHLTEMQKIIVLGDVINNPLWKS